ncbi:molybdopterin-synthase adenylyltransferase MoeB [Aliidiomarina halalkaliphila]|uniref:Molybdopterin-synthase adenylyltransferase MoeB n=1 Tax=Aliidiomarina halalkaliphila TaxID=2593535 RepID=A0A552X3P4_9GAMM|nr:molybdopterin-synthase adenylyltransferase MoeB [Aliidiomarina halalkaliphila]TRW49651.1 molybdopterin-synthase adenylyltransferase MoeB [Aliidiomarina halalkaliphila]
MTQNKNTPLPPLNDVQTKRYARHILLPKMDFEGQERLVAARVLIVGLGGLGNAVAPYLAAAGVGTLFLADADVVELSNLQRQILFKNSDIGRAKVTACAEHLTAQNPDIQIHQLNQRVDQGLLNELLPSIDVVVDCTDNLETRNLLNAACYAHQVGLVSGAAIRMEGQITVLPMTQGAPCYQCFSRFFGEQELSCMTAGVLSPIVGVIGTMQALETIKLITGIGQSLTGRLLHFDGAEGEWQCFKFVQDPNCPVCNSTRS